VPARVEETGRPPRAPTRTQRPSKPSFQSGVTAKTSPGQGDLF
jgi:hypothetical protein